MTHSYCIANNEIWFYLNLRFIVLIKYSMKTTWGTLGFQCQTMARFGGIREEYTGRHAPWRWPIIHLILKYVVNSFFWFWYCKPCKQIVKQVCHSKWNSLASNEGNCTNMFVRGYLTYCSNILKKVSIFQVCEFTIVNWEYDGYEQYLYPGNDVIQTSPQYQGNGEWTFADSFGCVDVEFIESFGPWYTLRVRYIPTFIIIWRTNRCI